MTRTTCTTSDILTQNLHGFDGLRDGRNRQIGVMVKIYRKEYVTSDNGYGWDVEPGVYFVLFVKQTRGGVSFGPVQNGQFFKTYEEALSMSEKVVDRRRKEYAKKLAQQ